jgi:dTDP-4-amino-4,6-dideoxygalactose transaminase
MPSEKAILPMAELNMSISFLDLVTPHCELESALVEVFRTALKSGCFVGGSAVSEFEHAFADFCETSFCVGVGSGTDALRFAIIAAGVQPGETVLTVPNTFIATTEAISQAGAHPEFVDIEERTYNMDPEKLRHYLECQCVRDAVSGGLKSLRSGRRIAAIVPVHLYGQMADMDVILDLAGEYGLAVIEDACQAHGAQYFSRKDNRWYRAGSMGCAAAFSFYPGKNLGACGEAGAITTNDERLALHARRLRDHGQSKKYYHEMEGYNGRLDAIQAGILLVKLQHLDAWNESRRSHAACYKELLDTAGNPVVPPFEPSWSKSVYHLYVVRSEDRSGLAAVLKEQGIDTGIHYPIPLHMQDAYRSLGYVEGDFPASEKIAREIVSLPMFPHLQPSQRSRVVAAVVEFSGHALIQSYS